MSITERTLRNWRKEALELSNTLNESNSGQKTLTPSDAMLLGYAERALRMTQELMDKHLLRRKS